MSPFLAYFLIGVALIAFGILMIVKGSQKKGRCTASTTATITEVQEKLDIRTDNPGEVRRYRYTPIFSYQVNGRAYTTKGVYSIHRNAFRVGDTSQVWYDPQNPQEAVTKVVKSERSKAAIVLIILGIASCVLACTQL